MDIVGYDILEDGGLRYAWKDARFKKCIESAAFINRSKSLRYVMRRLLKKLAWLSVEDYGATVMEIIVASAMKGYLRRMSEEEALKKVESIIEPKIIQLFGESGAPMPVQSHVDGAKFAAFIDEAVADSIRELEVREDDMSGVSIVVLQNVEGKSMVETMSPEFVGFIGDAYRSLKYER